jgi:hypothetical protein
MEVQRAVRMTLVMLLEGKVIAEVFCSIPFLHCALDVGCCRWGRKQHMVACMCTNPHERTIGLLASAGAGFNPEHVLYCIDQGVLSHNTAGSYNLAVSARCHSLGCGIGTHTPTSTFETVPKLH